ncbi:MAG: hypothetical protein RL398_3562 [Planctomycetota bacterium]|jgi:peptidyl-prolyl cis-trans isomerase B (cyclophilin B)
MIRFLSTVILAATVGLLPTAVSAQAPSGVRATLTPVRTIVGAAGDIELRLAIDVTADTEVPGALLTGVALDVKIGDGAGPRIDEAGKGGSVALAAGTRIERTVKMPAGRFVPNADPSAFSVVSVQWRDLPGANCVFKIAPDTSKVDLDKINLATTEVVLITNHGEMTVGFLPEKAPKTVRNFLELCKSGFYDGTKFHRVIRNFMIQGGDPLTKDDKMQSQWGTGGSGKNIDAEFNDTRHVRGVLSMARSNDPNSASSQFFVVHKDSPHLDEKYTAFGNLVKGADTLDSIANTMCGGPQGSTPLQPVILHAAVILPGK